MLHFGLITAFISFSKNHLLTIEILYNCYYRSRNQQSIEFVVKPLEDLYLEGKDNTIMRVHKDQPYPCQMQKTQQFSCLFRHYAKHNGLKKEELMFYFVDELKPDETPETVHLMQDDIIKVGRRGENVEKIEADTQDERSGSLQDFQWLLETGDHSDITFIVGEDATEIKGHKAVLAARSEYFRSMFKPSFSESNRDSIRIAHHSADTFKHMMEYLYTGIVTDLVDKGDLELTNLLCLAGEYRDTCLLHKVETIVGQKVNDDNLYDFFTLSTDIHADGLKRKCAEYYNDPDNKKRLKEDAEFVEKLQGRSDILMYLLFDQNDGSMQGNPAKKRKTSDTNGETQYTSINSNEQ